MLFWTVFFRSTPLSEAQMILLLLFTSLEYKFALHFHGSLGMRMLSRHIGTVSMCSYVLCKPNHWRTFHSKTTENLKHRNWWEAVLCEKLPIAITIIITVEHSVRPLLGAQSWTETAAVCCVSGEEKLCCGGFSRHRPRREEQCCCLGRKYTERERGKLFHVFLCLWLCSLDSGGALFKMHS